MLLYVKIINVFIADREEFKKVGLKENKMGVMPVTKLVITMSLPIIVSMLIQALYNIVDSMFVAKLNEEALTAVSLAFPIQNLMIAFASGTAVGVNALLSRSLGEKNYDKVNKIAVNGVVLAFVSYLLFLFFGVFAAEIFFKTQTDIPEIIQGGTSYLRICCVLSFGVFGQITFERLMQSTGKTVYSMITQSIGAIINIILDPIFIFGYGPFPKMGIAGAAYATVVGQIIALILAVILNNKFNTEINLSFRNYKPDFKIIGRIYYIGIPSIIMVSIGSIMTYSLNKILISFSSTAAAVFGVYFKLQSFVFMPIFGLNNGVIPIIAFNYGARNRKRMLKTVKVSLLFAVSIMFAGFLTMQIFPEKLLKIFSASDNMLSIGIPALKTISLCFVFAGVCIVLVSVFQALGKSIFSMSVSICRQLVILLPVAYLFSLTGNVSNVWFAFPIAELVSLLMIIVGFTFIYKKEIKLIPDGADC